MTWANGEEGAENGYQYSEEWMHHFGLENDYLNDFQLGLFLQSRYYRVSIQKNI